MQDVTKDRDKYIGGSDIPIIMGLSPFKTRFELAQEKAGIKEDDFKGNEYTEYGNYIEPIIRQYINEKYGYNFVEDKIINGNIRYHADGRDAGRSTTLEVKSTSQIHTDLTGYKKYTVQLAFGMDQFKDKHGLLAVYDRPDDFSEEFDPKRLQIFNIEREDVDEILLLEIDPAVANFVKDVEKLKENPFMTEEDLQPHDITRWFDRVTALEGQMLAFKDLEKQYKDAKENLKKAMEDHCIKKWTTNNGTQITLVPDGKDTTAKVFDEKTFTAENPEMAEKYMIEKVKKGRTGYVRITPPKDKLNTAG